MTADVWAKLGLLSDKIVREIACIIHATPGRTITLVALVKRPSLKELGANEAKIRKLANEMFDADLLDRTGTKRSGYSFTLKALHVKELTWDSVYEMHRGKKLPRID